MKKRSKVLAVVLLLADIAMAAHEKKRKKDNQ